MIYCFDIDGTICTNTNGAYEHASPIGDVIQSVNALFDEGHTIYFYTARGATTGIDWSIITKKQLSEWGVRYHEIFFGKPTADVYVDDKCFNVVDWMRSQEVRKGG